MSKTLHIVVEGDFNSWPTDDLFDFSYSGDVTSETMHISEGGKLPDLTFNDLVVLPNKQEACIIEFRLTAKVDGHALIFQPSSIEWLDKDRKPTHAPSGWADQRSALDSRLLTITDPNDTWKWVSFNLKVQNADGSKKGTSDPTIVNRADPIGVQGSIGAMPGSY